MARKSAGKTYAQCTLALSQRNCRRLHNAPLRKAFKFVCWCLAALDYYWHQGCAWSIVLFPSLVLQCSAKAPTTHGTHEGHRRRPGLASELFLPLLRLSHILRFALCLLPLLSFPAVFTEASVFPVLSTQLSVRARL